MWEKLIISINAGQCGSCYTFSATGALESRYAIKTKNLVSRSEQYKVDCVYGGIYVSDGCNGGYMTDVFDYVAKNGDFAAASYPYTFKTKKGTCKTSRTKRPDALLKNNAYTEITPGDEDSLVQAIQSGPVAVAIDASSSDFQSYAGGVFTNCTTTIDHAGKFFLCFS